MSPPIKRCHIELPLPWKVLRLFQLDGIETVGFWTGERFMASGASVTVWGWQEIEAVDSFEASRFVANAIGSTPVDRLQPSERARHAEDDHPRPFHIIRLRLSTGEVVFGLWDGTAYIHRGRKVAPLSWTPVRLAA